MIPTYLLLGANGDLCAMLPFFEWQHTRTGRRTRVCCAQEFAPLFDGVSYVELTPYPGHYSEFENARRMLHRGSHHQMVHPLQVFNNPTPVRTDSFVKEMWRLADQPESWDAWPLVFDRRNEAREAALLKSVRDGRRPMILVGLDGKSSPLPTGAAQGIFECLYREFPDHQIVDLAHVRGERIYDLLGLYDAAKLLVSSDTVHLHLSRGSEIPVAAFIADTPTAWHGAPHYSNQIARVRYGKISAENIMPEIRAALAPPSRPVKRTLIHVWSEYTRTGDGLRRHKLALRSWERESHFSRWKARPVLDRLTPRNTRTALGDVRPLPFVRDVIGQGIIGAKDTDVIVLSNDDIGFTPGITQQITRCIEARGACFAHRWDSDHRLHRLLEPWEIRKLKWYPGNDLFAFTVAWWRKHGPDFPDMALGCEAWDWILRELVRASGGLELFEAIYHEKHASQWERDRLTAPGNIHNRRLAREWLTKRGLPLNELAGVD